MHFLPDVYVPCEVCKGRRYNRETLEVKYKDKSIFDVLDMNVEEAAVFFENIPSISRQLQTLLEVGLGYIKLGQPSTQLSGGEAQRIKLASELSRKSTGKTLYILDDHIIDLGPDGGFRGGTIVAEGTPEEVAECGSSYTGQFLKRILL